MASGPSSGCCLHSDDGSCRSGTVLRRVHRAAQKAASKVFLSAGVAAMLAAGSSGGSAGSVAAEGCCVGVLNRSTGQGVYADCRVQGTISCKEWLCKQTVVV